MGIESTTSWLDLPLLCRLSYKVAQRKSGTIHIHIHIYWCQSSVFSDRIVYSDSASESTKVYKWVTGKFEGNPVFIPYREE